MNKFSLEYWQGGKWNPYYGYFMKRSLAFRFAQQKSKEKPWRVLHKGKVIATYGGTI